MIYVIVYIIKYLLHERKVSAVRNSKIIAGDLRALANCPIKRIKINTNQLFVQPSWTDSLTAPLQTDSLIYFSRLASLLY